MYPRDVILHSGQHLNFTIIGDSMFNEIIFLLILSYSLSLILPFLLYLLIKCYILINSMICYFCEDKSYEYSYMYTRIKFGKCFKYNHLSTTQNPMVGISWMESSCALHGCTWVVELYSSGCTWSISQILYGWRVISGDIYRSEVACFRLMS